MLIKRRSSTSGFSPADPETPKPEDTDVWPLQVPPEVAKHSIGLRVVVFRRFRAISGDTGLKWPDTRVWIGKTSLIHFVALGLTPHIEKSDIEK